MMEWGYQHYDRDDARNAPTGRNDGTLNGSEVVGVGSLPPVGAPEPALVLGLDDPEILRREASSLSEAIPREFAAVLNQPTYSPEAKLDMVRTLIRISEKGEITEQDVDTAGPVLREAVAALKAEQDAKEEQAQQMKNLVLTPVAGVLAVTAATPALLAPVLTPEPEPELAPVVLTRFNAQNQPYGLSCGRFECVDLGDDIAAAYDRIFAEGPLHTPGMERQQQQGRST